MKLETFFKLIFLLLMPILIGSCLLSCTTTKEVVKIETRYDSTAIKQSAALQRVLSEELERHEKERQEWESTGVFFYPADSVGTLEGATTLDWRSTPSKITFENGKIKEVQGSIKSVNQSRFEKDSEVIELKKKVDSLTAESKKSKTEVSVETEIKTAHKETKVWPFWIFGICLLAGALIEAKFKFLTKLLRYVTIKM